MTPMDRLLVGIALLCLVAAVVLVTDYVTHPDPLARKIREVRHEA